MPSLFFLKAFCMTMNYKDIEDNAYKMRTKKYEADLYAKLNAENPPKKMNVLVVNDVFD